MISGIGTGVSLISSLFGQMNETVGVTPVGKNDEFGSIYKGAVSTSATQETSESSNVNSEMDLNNDGQVTMAEMVKYLELQTQEQISENTDAFDIPEIGQERPFTSKLSTGVKQALKAYSAFV